MARSGPSSAAGEPPSARSEWKKHIWNVFEVAHSEELERDFIQFHWHWAMFPLIDLVGPELVYAVGLKALGYPPTFADTQKEADIVDAAIIQHLNGEEVHEFIF